MARDSRHCRRLDLIISSRCPIYETGLDVCEEVCGEHIGDGGSEGGGRLGLQIVGALFYNFIGEKAEKSGTIWSQKYGI